MDKSLQNTRDPKQAERMQILKERGLCYFCQKENNDNIPFPNKVFDAKFWYITKNDYPLDGQVHFYMIVLKRHAEDEEQVNALESTEYPCIISWLVKEILECKFLLNVY